MRTSDAARPSRSSAPRSPRPLTALAAVAVVGSVASMVWQAVHNQLLHVGGGCGYDGAQYCAMAKGMRAQAPYSRRVAPSAIVRVAHFGSVLDRFRVLDIVACLVAAVAVGLIVYRLSTGPGRRAAAVVAAAVVPLWPVMFHHIFVSPAYTDIVAMAFGMSWVAAVLRERPGWYTPVLAGATVLSREPWAIVFVVAVVVIGWRHPPLARRLAIDAVVAVVAFVGALLVPTRPGGIDTGFVATAHMWLTDNFGSAHDIARLAWFVGNGMGFVWLALLRRPWQLVADWRRAALVAVAATHAVLALTGGGDTDRLLLVTGVVLTALAAVELASGRLPVAPFALLLLATVLQWRPWHNSGPTATAYVHYWALRAAPWAPHGMRARILADTRLVILPLALGVAALVFWPRPQPARA